MQQILRTSITESVSKKIVRRYGLVLIAALVGIYAMRRGFEYKDVLLAGGALIAGIIVFGGERGIQYGFVLWALSMAIGYRTFEITKGLRIHPAEVLLCLLFATIFAHRRLNTEHRISLPMWVCLFLPFWGLGWWPVVSGDVNWALMFSEFRSFLMLIPLLCVAQIVLRKERNWRYVVTGFFLASTWIAVMGVLEYWLPSVTKLFPAFIKQATPGETAEGFVRATFSFWGSQDATFICALSVPMAVVLFRWWKDVVIRFLLVFSSILQLVAIYIGGFRSLWLIVVVQVVAACLLGLRKHGLAVAAACVLVAAVGYSIIPKSEERVISTIAVLQGAPIDHSALVRKERALEAFDAAISAPLGRGWSSAGWVHSDFLQVAANLGIVAALIFIGGFLFTFWKLAVAVKTASSYPRSDTGELGFSLFLSFIMVGGLLATQGVEVLPQLILPVWFVWALVEVWLQQRARASEPSHSYVPANFYPAANFR